MSYVIASIISANRGDKMFNKIGSCHKRKKCDSQAAGVHVEWDAYNNHLYPWSLCKWGIMNKAKNDIPSMA